MILREALISPIHSDLQYKTKKKQKEVYHDWHTFLIIHHIEKPQKRRKIHW